MINGISGGLNYNYKNSLINHNNTNGLNNVGIYRDNKSPQDKMNVTDVEKSKKLDGKCTTCESRKYVDGSDDPGVSFKTPTNISPEASFNAVRAHESEHVSNNNADAKAKNGEVVSQTVSYDMGVCAECGKVYMAGGTTITVTKYNSPVQDKGNFIDVYA